MMMDRLQAELAVLSRKFLASRFGMVWTDNPRLEVILPIASETEAFGVYKVKIYGLGTFPEEEPIVTPGKILIDRNGEKMTGPSRANHLLSEYNGETHMCLFSEWNPRISLNKIAFRAAAWLLAYHLHLKTGRSLDSYLSHGA